MKAGSVLYIVKGNVDAAAGYLRISNFDFRKRMKAEG
jgi:hypothetical protein